MTLPWRRKTPLLIAIARTAAQIKRCHGVMRELRPHFKRTQTFLERDSGVQRFDARRFYFREGMKIASPFFHEGRNAEGEINP
jgi:hypothetical protein